MSACAASTCGSSTARAANDLAAVWISTSSRASSTSSTSCIEKVATTAPTLGLRCTSPSTSSRSSASRTGVRLTPSSLASAPSVITSPAS